MAIIESDPREGGVRLRVKAVPGASQDRIAGVLGDRLKVRIAQTPEGGRANRAICELVQRTIGVKGARVEVASGASSAEKVLRISGADEATVRKALGVEEQGGPRG